MSFLPVWFFVVGILAGSAAYADGYMRPTVMYLSEGAEQGSKSTTTRSLLDFAAGYMHPSGVTLGLLYSTEHRKSITSTLNGNGTFTDTQVDGDRLSVGPSLGWAAPGDTGPYLMATYFNSTELTGSNNGTIYGVSSTTKSSGTGYQGDAGIRFGFRKVSLAFQLSYKHFAYTKQSTSTATTDLSPVLKETYVDPYFAVWAYF